MFLSAYIKSAAVAPSDLTKSQVENSQVPDRIYYCQCLVIFLVYYLEGALQFIV